MAMSKAVKQTRKINGKRFTLKIDTPSKSDAKKSANKIRKKGNNARVIQYTQKYPWGTKRKRYLVYTKRK